VIPPPPKPKHAPGTAKLWLYRGLAAVVVPAAFLVGLEYALQLAGFGQPASFMIPDEKPGYFRTNPRFASSVLPGGFDLRPLNFRLLLRKPPNTLRVVVLGESAAQGVPAPQYGFAAQLRAQLRNRYPGRDVEVVNTGIVAVNSHVVYQVARQMAEFSPDVFVVYAGNNEVVGPYGPGCVYLSEMPPLWVIRLSSWVKATRTGQLVNTAIGKVTLHGHPPAEWGGMPMFVNSAVNGDDPRLEKVYRNFEANLRDIVRVASGAGAKTILCTVASNIRDCAPFLSTHRKGLSEAELAAWTRSFNRGRAEWLLEEGGTARTDLLEAVRIDAHYADCWFMLGSLDLKAGDIASARRHFIEAQHWDALRFRPDPSINDAVRRVAESAGEGVALLDTAALLGSDSSSTAEPAGRGLFFEHVHLDWEGNFILARAVAERMEEALGGKQGTSPAWLDSAGCAESLVYTSHERYSVLESMGAIVQNPPFTNQLTYCEDQARLLNELAAAHASRVDPQVLRHAREVAASAMAKDPGNPDLPKVAEGIDDDLGDTAASLVDVRKAAELQPRDFTLATNEAVRLMRLSRNADAEALLRETARTCSPRDRSLMAPAFADLFTRTGQISEGRKFLDAEILKEPSFENLRMVRAQFWRFTGNNSSAENEYRSILAEDPSSRNALEAFVNLLGATGQTDAADQETLASVALQPRNFANNLRAASLYGRRKDDAHEVQYLLAAESSGPMTSATEQRLAQRLLSLGRPDEALTHLALARRVSLYEGNPLQTVQISTVIERLESQMR